MNLHVLLVEDSPQVRESLVETLRGTLDAEVLKVADGEADARDWLNNNTDWSVAIVDLFIKDGTGPGVLMALRNRSPQQRAVVLSGYVTGAIREKCHMLGADRVFDKATEIEELLEYLATVRSEDRGGSLSQRG